MSRFNKFQESWDAPAQLMQRCCFSRWRVQGASGFSPSSLKGQRSGWRPQRFVYQIHMIAVSDGSGRKLKCFAADSLIIYKQKEYENWWIRTLWLTLGTFTPAEAMESKQLSEQLMMSSRVTSVSWGAYPGCMVQQSFSSCCQLDESFWMDENTYRWEAALQGAADRWGSGCRTKSFSKTWQRTPSPPRRRNEWVMSQCYVTVGHPVWCLFGHRDDVTQSVQRMLPVAVSCLSSIKWRCDDIHVRLPCCFPGSWGILKCRIIFCNTYCF